MYIIIQNRSQELGLPSAFYEAKYLIDNAYDARETQEKLSRFNLSHKISFNDLNEYVKYEKKAFRMDTPHEDRNRGGFSEREIVNAGNKLLKAIEMYDDSTVGFTGVVRLKGTYWGGTEGNIQRGQSNFNSENSGWD